MNEPHPQSADGAELREQLTAYLDGELDAAATRDIERRMAREPQVQEELRQLQQAWDLLDRLPLSEVDAKFTRSTVEMIAVQVEQEAEPPAGRFWTRSPWLWRAAGLAIACAAGFAIVQGAWPDRNRQLLRDLPVLENLEAYRQTPDVKFLKAAGFFAADDSPLASEDLEQRKTRVEKMTPDEQEQLWRRYERFRVLPAAEQTRLRSLDAELDQAAESDQLRAAIANYQRWLEQLTSAERAELTSLSPNDRLKRIAQWRGEQARRLGPEDMQAFAQWFEALLARRRPALAAKLPPPERAAERKAQIRRIIEAQFARAGANRPPPDAGPGGQKRFGWSAADFDELRGALSEKARKQFDEAAAPAERRKLLAGWLRQVYWRNPGAGPNLARSQGLSEEQLRKFFDEEIDVSERARLLSLPLEQMQRQLRQLYWKRHPQGNRGEPKAKETPSPSGRGPG